MMNEAVCPDSFYSDESRYLHKGKINAESWDGLWRVGFKRKFTVSFFSVNLYSFSLWFIVTQECFKVCEGQDAARRCSSLSPLLFQSQLWRDMSPNISQGSS